VNTLWVDITKKVWMLHHNADRLRLVLTEVLTDEERQELKQLKQNSRNSPGLKKREKQKGRKDDIAKKARQLESISRS